MTTLITQTDLKITDSTNYTNTQKATLALSPTGDLLLVSGHDKLCEQILRAIANDSALGGGVLNKPTSVKNLRTLVTMILRTFRQNQIIETKKMDPDFDGFGFFRKASGTSADYTRVSGGPVVYKFVDTNLEDNVIYDYGITKMYNGVFESNFVEKLSITPTSFLDTEEIVVGNSVIALPESRQITFYVDYNRTFLASEILDTIVSISIEQDQQEPRKFTIQVLVTDYSGNQVPVSSRKIDLKS